MSTPVVERESADGLRKPMTDVMDRLRAVHPMPRGERLSCRYRDGKLPSRRAWNLLLRSVVLGALMELLEQDYSPIGDASTFWREFAAPLRRCRDQRQDWRRLATSWKSESKFWRKNQR